ncbi:MULTISPECIES: aldo/keto reductase [Hymenobacter]|uniref:Predicted oxidoreductase n=3 Tax=Hymenobacter TaxID=89966 RepID=A0A239BA22_9BACT|nr:MULTISPECIES: aldo/keto reductase [Hymenobacter]MBR7952113.1 aldo/keto reductase [Microvirga sp. STR05]MBD2717197.1 aldo/keto reductase [Hymenobacter duratus]MDF7815569.1 aldo/keto reductase [Hymenobacter sp. YC55]UPL51341.1 aldo/keto reductase [Hymenobacter sublimis]SNS04371.1 Predicted oxidoreductase [Hymenobacter mucosus]
MQYRLLGQTGLKVSALCLGTMTFGGKGRSAVTGALDQTAADELLRRAVAAGVNFIDTANVYSEGLSEEITGQAIRNLGLDRDSLVLATKVRGKMGEGPNEVGLTRKHIMQQAEASLKRLHTDYLDLYQLHAYDPLTPLDETLRALDDLVRQGKVRYIGASNLAAWQLMKALATADSRQLERFASLQAYYTIAGRDLEREMVPLLLDQKVGLLVWSPLAGGLLSGKYTRDGQNQEGGRRDRLDFPLVDRNRAFNVLDVLHPLAETKGATVAQLALAWLLHQPVVSSVIMGATKPEQLDANLAAVDVTFTPEELRHLEEVSQLPAEYPGWMLNYTTSDRTIS